LLVANPKTSANAGQLSLQAAERTRQDEMADHLPAGRQNDRDEGRPDPLKLTAQALAAAVGVAASDPNPTALGIGIAAGLALVPDALGLAASWYRSRSERRWVAYFALLDDLLKGRKTAGGHLVAQLFNDPGNEAIHELVVESARVVGEAMAPSAIPVMARMTSEYASTGKTADHFFRALRRVLTDVTEPEFSDMRALLTLIVAQSVDAPYLQLECVGPLSGSAEDGVRPTPVSLEITPVTMVTGSMTEGARSRCDPLPQRTPRVFQLVIANGLAERGSLIYGATQPASCMIESAMVRRLSATISSPQ
jgi:hypothetical protein